MLFLHRNGEQVKPTLLLSTSDIEFASVPLGSGWLQSGAAKVIWSISSGQGSAPKSVSFP